MADTDTAVSEPTAPPNGRPLPETIKPVQDLTPNEMRALKAETGRSLTELVGGDPEDLDKAPERIQSLVWVALKRAGYVCSWEQAGDVRPDMSAQTVDPTNVARLTS